MIVFDASTLVSAALKADSVTERALLRAREDYILALSTEVDAEIAEVLARPKFRHLLSEARRHAFLTSLRARAFWVNPTVRVTDCRDTKDNIYLELALEAGAGTIVSSDRDLLVLNPWRGMRVLSPSEYLAVN